MSQNVWGDKDTEFFFDLGIDNVLDAIESAGFKCTGRCNALNSMENRVYDVELEADSAEIERGFVGSFRIAKFYRPGRWSKEQILEEHSFLKDLHDNELPAVAPLPFEDGETLHKVKGTEIYFCLFPKVGGRMAEELQEDTMGQLARLLARMHNVGATKEAKHRVKLTPTTYGVANLKYLVDHKKIPADLETPYKTMVESICNHIDPWFQNTKTQRVHGDCHLGNVMFGPSGFFLVDFDDMVIAPPVQDIWLLLPERPQNIPETVSRFIEAYEVMRAFDRNTLKLIEPLRALRYVHFAAWIAKRYEDPAFQRAFPYVTEADYWHRQLQDLNEQWQIIQTL